MLNAIITHQGNTLLLEFPCKRMLLAEHLASIGIRTQPSDIKCIDEEDAPSLLCFFMVLFDRIQCYKKVFDTNILLKNNIRSIYKKICMGYRVT